MMKLSISAVLAVLLVSHMPSAASAQASAAAAQAQAEARGRLVCGAGTLVSAQYLPGGLLRVTCSQQSQSSNASNAAIAGTGLAVGPLLGAVLGVTLVGIVGGGGSPSQSVSSTPSTPVTSTSASR